MPRKEEPFPDLRLARNSMGTRFELALFGGDKVHLQAAGEAALDEIEILNDQLDLFKPASFLSHLNREAATKPVRLDPALFALIEQCRTVQAATDGAFDPAVGPLMACWGFHGNEGAQPDERARRQAALQSGMDKVVLDRRSCSIRYSSPGVRLDFGAVAKGYALDRAAKILRAAGIRTAFLHGGSSSILALGAPPGRGAWKVAIENPCRAGDWLRIVSLNDCALSVSSPLGRSFEVEGRVKGHIMDPRQGAPADAAILAAVVSSSAALADAWSTALVVRGPALLKKLGQEPGEMTGLVCSGQAPDRSVEIDGSHPDRFMTTSRARCAQEKNND